MTGTWEAPDGHQPELNGAAMDPRPTPDIPDRLATEMQAHIIHLASTSDYMIGRAERDDMAVDYAYHLIDQNAVDPASLAFDALHLWRRMYGRGFYDG